jgi:hypothetical protein
MCLQLLKVHKGGKCDRGMEFGLVKSVGNKIAWEYDMVGRYLGYVKRWLDWQCIHSCNMDPVSISQ